MHGFPGPRPLRIAQGQVDLLVNELLLSKQGHSFQLLSELASVTYLEEVGISCRSITTVV